jgi:hypothetical protein
MPLENKRMGIRRAALELLSPASQVMIDRRLARLATGGPRSQNGDLPNGARGDSDGFPWKTIGPRKPGERAYFRMRQP